MWNRHLSNIICWLLIQQAFVVLAKSHSSATSTTTTTTTTTTEAPGPTAAVAEDQELDEDGDGEQEIANKTRDVKSELEGASRVGYGIPSDPHPSIKAIYKNPTYKVPMIGGHLNYVTNRPDPQEHFFVGHGVMLDKDHVLTDHESWENTHIADDTTFNTLHWKAPHREIDVAAPDKELHETKSKIWLDPVKKRVGGSGLSLFAVKRGNGNYIDQQQGVAPAKLETNPKEFGSDCFLHGYGQAIGSSSSSSSGPASFYKTTQRQYVKTPLEMSLADCAPGSLTCQLVAKNGHNICPVSASGAPIFCGKEEKLTYMAKPSAVSALGCPQQFDAYHIPRLVGHIQPHLNT